MRPMTTVRMIAALLVLMLFPATAQAKMSLSGIDVARQSESLTFTTSHLYLKLDLADGYYDVVWAGNRLSGATSEADLASGVSLYAPRYVDHVCRDSDILPINDRFGKGIQVIVHHTSPGLPEMRQTFQVYRDRDYLFTQVAVVSGAPVSSNSVTPLVADRAQMPAAGLTLDAGDRPRTLFVPYDNDNWVWYNSNYASGSYEVTAAYDNASRHGFVIGSISHDTWKTGLQMSEITIRTVGRIRVYGGASDYWTHDTVPHGMVTGRVICSPRVFVGCFPDWRDGLETYGRANAIVSPHPQWAGGPPVGWNSYYAVGSRISAGNYVATARVFGSDLVRSGFHDAGGSATINLDGWWDFNITPEETRDAVRQIHALGLKAGVYWAPFAWWHELTQLVPGTNGQYRIIDIVQRDSAGKMLPKMDGGQPLDPTAPGTRELNDYEIKLLVGMGFDYIKLDFLNFGALESNHHDPAITTGIEAYNFGMRRIMADLSPTETGRRIFVDLGISPIFPCYGDSRFISCEVHNRLYDCEYEMNAVNYGWWLAGSNYTYNDPDMLWLSEDDTVARTRINTCVVTGGMLIDGNDETQTAVVARSRHLFCNKAILDLARTGRTFRPVEGDARAADIYERRDPLGVLYVAVFNWNGDKSAVKNVSFARLTLSPSATYDVENIWTGAKTQAKASMDIPLRPGESQILRLTRAPL